MNGFVMDCIRAVMTGKRKIGGLGFVKDQKEGCVTRGKGKNVRANRDKTGARIEGYKSLGCMRNALLTSRDAYNNLVANLCHGALPRLSCVQWKMLFHRQ